MLNSPLFNIRATRIATLAACLLGSLFAASIACAQQDLSSQALNDLERAALFPSQADIAQGRKLAESHCSSCHGLDGVAEDPALPNLAAQRTVYLYRQLGSYRNGGRDGPEMHDTVEYLDDSALLKAAIYYASLNGPQKPASAEPAWMSNDDPLRTVRAATAGCAGCHGPDGNSRVPGMPSLTAQHPEYFVTAMNAYRSGARTHGMMQMLVASLSDEKIAEMGLFYALQEPAPATAPLPGDVEAGRAASEPCASCHGADGNTTAPGMPTLAGQDAAYLVVSMKSYLEGGRDHETMQQAMTGTNSSIINDMAAFYASQKPLARQVRKPLTTSEWLQRCARCHGMRGESSDPRIPSLAGQNAAYLVTAMQAYTGNDRGNRIMHAMSDPLSATDIQRLAEYFESQTPARVVYIEPPCKPESGVE